VRAPVFALLGLTEPEIKLRATMDPSVIWLHGPYSVRSQIREQYTALARDLHRVSGRFGRRAMLTYRFRGAIPDETRAKIRSVHRSFEQVYLLAETTPESWRLERVGKSFRQQVRDLWDDPLVVGYAAGTLWLIDSFDPTPLEQYVASEFTS
jgi:hypothetical protein